MARGIRGSQTSISLFSFQDIMTAVMGVLILVTLLMALDLTESAAEQPDVDPQPQPAQADDLDPLRERVEQLQQRYEQTMQWMQLFQQAGLPHQRQQQLQAAEHEVVFLAEQLVELQARVQQQISQMDQQAQQMQQIQADLDEIDLLQVRLAQLQQAIGQQRLTPRMTYIMQGGQSRSPVLLQIQRGAFGISLAGPDEPALWLTASDLRIRRQQLLELAGTRNPQQEYFVILLKPSGFVHYEQVAAELSRAGFSIGTELVDESTTFLTGQP